MASDSLARADWIADTLADLPALLTTDEACTALRVSRRNLYRWISTGRLHAVKTAAGNTGGGRVLVPRTAVAAYLRSLESAA
jgi:excisionase family DNA binding protein